MEENKQSENGGQLVVTVEGAKQKMAIALTKLEVSAQALQNEANALVFNEDNVENIKKFLEKSKKAKKAIDDAHEEGKKPFLSAGRAWDTAKKDSQKVIADIDGPVSEKYTALCNSIEKKRLEQEKHEAEKVRINKLIEDTGLSFSQNIANCTSRSQLNDVERLINLEKSPSRAGKYGDYHPDAISRFDELLLPILKDQKKKIDEKEALEAQLSAASDPSKYDEISAKLEQKQNEIIQNRVQVQEMALNQQKVIDTSTSVVFPEIKATRTDIVAEIDDMAVVFKRTPQLLNIELKLLEAKKIGKKLQEDGEFGDKDELVKDGIKYKIKKSW